MRLRKPDTRSGQRPLHRLAVNRQAHRRLAGRFELQFHGQPFDGHKPRHVVQLTVSDAECDLRRGRAAVEGESRREVERLRRGRGERAFECDDGSAGAAFLDLRCLNNCRLREGLLVDPDAFGTELILVFVGSRDDPGFPVPRHEDDARRLLQERIAVGEFHCGVVAKVHLVERGEAVRGNDEHRRAGDHGDGPVRLLDGELGRRQGGSGDRKGVRSSAVRRQVGEEVNGDPLERAVAQPSRARLNGGEDRFALRIKQAKRSRVHHRAPRQRHTRIHRVADPFAPCRLLHGQRYFDCLGLFHIWTHDRNSLRISLLQPRPCGHPSSRSARASASSRWPW